MGRVENHPVLDIPSRRDIPFTFEGKVLFAKEGEVLSSALIAQGIHVFGYHRTDRVPQGIFCANGQCSQCTVIVNGRSVKACMTVVQSGTRVTRCIGDPSIPEDDTVPPMKGIRALRTQFLIVGGGPAGLSAAVELAKHGIRGILIDDKARLGGKLTLQTHTFFGSRGDCYAGTRGIDIGIQLEEELKKEGGDLVQVWLNATAVGVFCDRMVGVVRDGTYMLVRPEVFLVATGAREKTLAFPGCDLPGIYGAGAFQTLVNRDLVRPTEKLFICGGGNVGLISAYHALQAGIDVKGLVEVLPECGGYRVHLDKLRRLGVPVYTSHTVLRAMGKERLERVTICGIDGHLKPIPGTEKTFSVDTLLIAVGLSPIRELFTKAEEYGMKVFAAGDADEIAEASAAMFSGRIAGRKMVRELGTQCLIPREWDRIVNTLRSKPGKIWEFQVKPIPGKVYPVIRCIQEIPCDPCAQLCPRSAIRVKGNSITALPVFEGEMCLGCAQCVVRCPGLAIILVDERSDPEQRNVHVTIPVELGDRDLEVGQEVTTVGCGGEAVGKGRVIAYRQAPSQDRRRLLLIEVPFHERLLVAGIRTREDMGGVFEISDQPEEDTIVCRCERVTKGQIVELIKAGYRDMNQIKALLRTGMGACGGKTCSELILNLFREEGVDLQEVTRFVERPPVSEVPLWILAGVKPQRRDENSARK